MILTNYAIKFRTAVLVLAVLLVVFGSISYMTLPREGAPDITIPYVFVTALYEGTAPSEMEKLVTIPLEKKLNELENVKKITSATAEGVSSVVIEFDAGQNIDMARQLVKNKIDLAAPDLPKDIDEPVVNALNFSTDFPVLIFTLSGLPDLMRLKNLAEDMQDQIELLSGVKEAAVTGIREREIRVELDLPRLVALNIPVAQVMQRIRQENRTTSAGNLEVAGDKFQIRVPGEFELVAEMPGLIVAERDGKPIFLRDVARVSDTFKDNETISRLNREPCVTISVKKRGGENTVALVKQVKKMIEKFALPPEVKLTIVMDESKYVADMIMELENNIASGFILVVMVLLIFLGVRNSLFVALAIPFSMLLSFIVMRFLGLTLNMIVLFSLVLACGMLVDNAIVIVENIYRHRTLGKTRAEAARIGAGEVAWPVLTSTLTTVAAFWPLMLWPDIMGQFMSYLPKTLIIVLMASLFVALVINPAICSILIQARPRESHVHTHPFMRAYETFLRGALNHRAAVLILGFAFLILSGQLYGRFGHGVELFPDTEPRNATVQLRFPQGTSLERTDVVIRQIEDKLVKYGDIKFFLASVGQGGDDMAGTGGQASHLGKIFMEFKEAGEREGNSLELVDRIREDVGQIAGADVKVERAKEGPPTGAPISIELSGDDFELLSELSADIKRKISSIPGLVDIQSDMKEALPELQFHVDRQRALLLGLDTDSIGSFLRSAIYGSESSKFRADEDEYDITVRLPLANRETIRLLDEAHIPTLSGQSIPLSSLGQVSYAGGRGDIRRKNLKRVVTISANNQERGVDVILKDIQKALADFQLPRGYKIDYTGDTEEMQKSGAFLMQAFFMAVGLITLILVLEFNSAVMPVIIMFTVILSMNGVLWGLLITGMRFGVIMTGLGVISLAGVVVNNAIVLIDYIQQCRQKGMEVTEAIVTAGKTRLRPVILTAITTVLGLIPMAIGYSLEIHRWPPRIIAGAESGAWWAPMAVAVIFGLSLATILTLVLVPAMYSVADSLATRVKRRFQLREE